MPDNIDVSRSNENVTLVDMDLRQAYREIFGEALERYNGKQKRADRKIEDYYEHIQKSKNGEKLFYEDVVQWGEKKDFLDPETRQRAKEALLEYATTFQSRNPNLRLVGAYLHMDEASPHLHIDYVPVAHGYTRGLETRNSLDRAMKAMGHEPTEESRKNNATKLWKESERAFFGKICRERGLEVEAERKSTRRSLSPVEYGEARDEMLAEIKELVDNLDEIAVHIASEGQKTVVAEDMTIPEKKSLWGKTEASERVGVFIENMDRGQAEALMQRVMADDKIVDILERTQHECHQLISTAKEEAESIRAEATADRNRKVAEADKIIRERESILSKARAWGERVKQQCQEATRSLETVKREISSMQDQKDALRGEIEGLKGEKAEMEREIPVLTARIIDAKAELVAVERAIKEKKTEGASYFGSMEEVNRAIAKRKEEKVREARLSLLERFVAQPQIKPLWEKFVELVSRNGRDNRGKSDKTDRER